MIRTIIISLLITSICSSGINVFVTENVIYEQGKVAIQKAVNTDLTQEKIQAVVTGPQKEINALNKKVLVKYKDLVIETDFTPVNPTPLDPEELDPDDDYFYKVSHSSTPTGHISKYSFSKKALTVKITFEGDFPLTGTGSKTEKVSVGYTNTVFDIKKTINKNEKNEISETVDFTLTDFDLTSKNCKSDSTKLTMEECNDLFKNYLANIKPQLLDIIKKSLTSRLQFNLLFSGLKSNNLISNYDGKTTVHLNGKLSSTPTLVQSSDNKARAYIFGFDGRASVNDVYPTQTTSSEDYKNFLFTNGNYQVSIKDWVPEQIISVFSKNFSDKIQVEKISGFNFSIQDLGKVFPQLYNHYFADEQYSVSLKFSDYIYSLDKPEDNHYKVNMIISLPKRNTEKNIELEFDFYTNKNTVVGENNEFNFTRETGGHVIGQVVVKNGENTFAYEKVLREFVFNATKDTYLKKDFQNALKSPNTVSNLFEFSKSLSKKPIIDGNNIILSLLR